MDLAPNHLNLNFELPAHAGLTIHQNETTQRLKQQLPNAKNRVIYESLSAEIQHAPTHPVHLQSQPASAVAYSTSPALTACHLQLLFNMLVLSFAFGT